MLLPLRALLLPSQVGQSYVSSVWTTLVAMVHAARIVVQACPEIMLCNGPGTGVPLCVLAFLCKVGSPRQAQA